MFNCAICKSEIEEDSFFCDQCGKEVFLCVECFKPGEGAFCEFDGSDMKAARSANGLLESPPTFNLEKTPEISTPESDPGKNRTLADSTTCMIFNKNLGLSLELKNGDIIGRSSGIHADKLANFNTISGRHLAFYFDLIKGWAVEDLNSSNGTKYNNNNQSWSGTSKLTPHTRTAISNGSYLLISNIEFLIQFNNSSSATQRI